MEQNVKKDIFGRPIEIGQWAVFWNRSKKTMLYGRVIKLTDKNVRIEYEGTMRKWKKKKEGKPGAGEYVSIPASALSYPQEIAIVNEDVVFWHRLQRTPGQK